MDAFVYKIIEYYKSIRVDDDDSLIDFNRLVQESIDLCRMQNPAIRFETQVDQSVAFKGDVFRLSVIFNNLISNAVKYQRPEEQNPVVKLSVKVGVKEATIVIEDNGIGILDEHLNNIFKMFFRTSYTVTGLGIGLFIVKEALSKIGGDISVSSEHGKGTTFTLIVPNKQLP
jgi:signal transduction histidine kinase